MEQLSPAGPTTAAQSSKLLQPVSGTCSTAFALKQTAPTVFPLLWGLIQDTDGKLYGTTWFGGTEDEGTVFKITPAGQLTTLYSFCSQVHCGDGGAPQAGLIQALNGKNSMEKPPRAGKTSAATAAAPAQFSKLLPLANSTRSIAFALKQTAPTVLACWGLVQATDGNLYGTTLESATSSLNIGAGTVFKITSAGQFTRLYSFCSQANCADDSEPCGELIQATDSNLYGTTSHGGAYKQGTVFEITPAGQWHLLYSFCSQANCADGSQPFAGLIQATDGNLYGTTRYGGIRDGGTAFSLDVGLGPFVKILLTIGRVGQRVLILGNNLTDATSVTFNGIAASFTVVASSVIQATVPSGATTGPVMVTTPGGSLTSNVNFHVKE